MNAHNQTGRPSLFPTGIGSLQLYWSREVLAGDMARCRAAGWQVVELDASSWPDADAAHSGLANGLGFPSYYGRNLDALDDVMAGVAEGRYGFASDAAGGLLVITGIDRLRTVEPRLTDVLVETLAATGQRALRFGWPLACFLQSDDPDFRVESGPPEPVGWNRNERSRAARQR